MCKEPLIKDINDGSTGLKADLMIRGFRGPQLRGSFDIGVTNSDAKCDSAKTFKKTSEYAELRKNKNTRHISFTPLVFSVDRVLSKQFQTFTERLVDRLATKIGILTWLCTRLSFSVLRATKLCIRGHERNFFLWVLKTSQWCFNATKMSTSFCT